MNEFEIRLRLQFVDSKTKSPFPCGVQILEKPVKPGNAEHVYRQVDKSAPRLQPGIEGGHKSAYSKTDHNKHQGKKPYAPVDCHNALM